MADRRWPLKRGPPDLSYIELILTLASTPSAERFKPPLDSALLVDEAYPGLDPNCTNRLMRRTSWTIDVLPERKDYGLGQLVVRGSYSSQVTCGDPGWYPTLSSFRYRTVTNRKRLVNPVGLDT